MPEENQVFDMEGDCLKRGRAELEMENKLFTELKKKVSQLRQGINEEWLIGMIDNQITSANNNMRDSKADVNVQYYHGMVNGLLTIRRIVIEKRED